MITWIVAGFVALIAIAVTVGVLEHTQRAAWREVARERRRRWEELHPRTDDHEYDPAWDQEA